MALSGLVMLVLLPIPYGTAQSLDVLWRVHFFSSLALVRLLIVKLATTEATPPTEPTGPPTSWRGSRLRSRLNRGRAGATRAVANGGEGGIRTHGGY